MESCQDRQLPIKAGHLGQSNKLLLI